MPKDIFCWLQVLRYLASDVPRFTATFFFAKLLEVRIVKILG